MTCTDPGASDSTEQLPVPEILIQAPGEYNNLDATMPIMPSGLKLPQPLKTDGNLATNWRRFKRTWDNYSIVARLGRFDEKFKTVNVQCNYVFCFCFCFFFIEGKLSQYVLIHCNSRCCFIDYVRRHVTSSRGYRIAMRRSFCE